MGIWHDILTVIFRLCCAAILGGVIGFERERENKPAGLRTHILVSIGCCLFMLISVYSKTLFGSSVTDPTRIAAQIVTGIGFLGAGSIIQARGAVYGLTTAASIWTVAAIGMAVGSGFYGGALFGTLLAWLVLSALDRWEMGRLFPRGKTLTFSLRIREKELVARAREFIDKRGIKVLESRVRRLDDGWLVSYRGTFPLEMIEEAQDLFSDTEGVSEISFGD